MMPRRTVAMAAASGSFPLLPPQVTRQTQPRVVRAIPQPDPRRLPAAALPRSRRAPPPIEDDSPETIAFLILALLLVLAVW